MVFCFNQKQFYYTMNSKLKNFIFFFLGALGMMLIMYFFNNYKIEKKNVSGNSEISYQKPEKNNSENSLSYQKVSKKNEDNSYQNSMPENHIDELTKEELVVKYLKEHGELPDYYITKSEAKNEGWIPSKGNLCEVAPGKAIGGDIWTNRQKSLPVKSGRKYYEADLNYNCGNRNADRVVFSNDGLIFVTYDHYKSFEEK